MDLSLNCVSCIIAQAGKTADLREAMMKGVLLCMSGIAFTSCSREMLKPEKEAVA